VEAEEVGQEEEPSRELLEEACELRMRRERRGAVVPREADDGDAGEGLRRGAVLGLLGDELGEDAAVVEVAVDGGELGRATRARGGRRRR